MQRVTIITEVNMIQHQFGIISIGMMSFETNQTTSCWKGQKTICNLQNQRMIGSITFPFLFGGFLLFSSSRSFKNSRFKNIPTRHIMNEKTNSKDTNPMSKGPLSTNDFKTQIQNGSSVIAKSLNYSSNCRTRFK